jgi:hypothetical protein
MSRHINKTKKKKTQQKKRELMAEPKNKKFGVWPLGVAEPPPGQLGWTATPYGWFGHPSSRSFLFFLVFFLGYIYIYDVALKNPSTMPHDALKPQVPRHV